jgi:hypothetical protein
MRWICLVVVSVVCLAGCSEFDEAQRNLEEAADTFEEQPGVIQIVAKRSVCWSGSIGNSTKEGCGSKSFRIKGESIIVANAQKQDEAGKLTMILEINGEEVDRSTTSAAYGVVQVSE